MKDSLMYIARRLTMLIPVLIGVTMLTFVVTHVVPSDPVSVALGPKATPEQVALMREQWGLDKPIYVQYGRYLASVLRGDLGVSMHTGRAVTEELASYIPATIELTTFSMALALVIGVPLGMLAAVRRDTLFDHATRFFSLIGISAPPFWLALLMLIVFYLDLEWFPGSGRLCLDVPPPVNITGIYTLDSLLTLNWPAFKDAVHHLILPGVCFSAQIVGVVLRMTRSSTLDVLRQDYIRTARAKGLRDRLILFRHILRNALIPVVSVSGNLYGQLLAGAILLETIFSWPGLGQYAVKSIMYMDLQPIMGFTLFVAILYVLVNLMTDILYVLIDPRIRLN